METSANLDCTMTDIMSVGTAVKEYIARQDNPADSASMMGSFLKMIDAALYRIYDEIAWKERLSKPIQMTEEEWKRV